MKNKPSKLNNFALENGYSNIYALLMDYSFIPMSRSPKHKKHELFELLRKKNKK